MEMDLMRRFDTEGFESAVVYMEDLDRRDFARLAAAMFIAVIMGPKTIHIDRE